MMCNSTQDITATSSNCSQGMNIYIYIYIYIYYQILGVHPFFVEAKS